MERKYTKKCLLTMLVIILICTLFLIPSNVSASTDKKYLALGDSIAEGLSLEDKNQRYTKIVQNYYNISDANFTDLSKSGMKAQELSANIRNYNYINAIKNADLITISIGSNELLSVLKQAIQEVKATHPNANAVELLFYLRMHLQSYEVRTELENGVAMYRNSWEDIVNYIKYINPNAVIVATQAYNPLYGILGLTDLAKTYVEQLNAIQSELSQNETRYYTAKIYEDFNVIYPKLTYMNISLSNFSTDALDPHPNTRGHRIIANRIIEVIPKTDAEIENIVTIVPTNKMRMEKTSSISGKIIIPCILQNEYDRVMGSDVKRYYQNAKNITVNGITLQDNTILKTGDVIKVNNEEKIIIIFGDINKDGEISISDVITLMNYIKEKINLTSVQWEAANVRNKIELTISDVLYWLNVITGSIDYKSVCQ